MKFSIVMPSYKSQYLQEAIESVLSQTYCDFELIIVDDCSPEDLKSIVEIFNDSRVKYFRNSSNYGALHLVENWNNSLNFCSGDYIINMGDDDRLLPCCLEEYVKLMDKYPELDVYHAKTQIIDENGDVFLLQDSRPEWESMYSMMYRIWNYDKHQYIGDFCIARRWLVENNGYVKFPYALNSDWSTVILAANRKGIANGNVSMFQYRKNRYSISRTQNIRTVAESLVDIQNFYLSLLQEKAIHNEDEVTRLILLTQCPIYYQRAFLKYISEDLKNTYNVIGFFKHWSMYIEYFGLSKKKLIKVIIKRLIYCVFD